MSKCNYVYHITSSCVSDKDDFVVADSVENAVNKYIKWYQTNQNKGIRSSDILTVERIGFNLEV